MGKCLPTPTYPATSKNQGKVGIIYLEFLLKHPIRKIERFVILQN